MDDERSDDLRLIPPDEDRTMLESARGAVLGLIGRMGVRKGDVEDVAQGAMLSVWSSMETHGLNELGRAIAQRIGAEAYVCPEGNRLVLRIASSGDTGKCLAEAITSLWKGQVEHALRRADSAAERGSSAGRKLAEWIRAHSGRAAAVRLAFDTPRRDVVAVIDGEELDRDLMYGLVAPGPHRARLRGEAVRSSPAHGSASETAPLTFRIAHGSGCGSLRKRLRKAAALRAIDWLRHNGLLDALLEADLHAAGGGDDEVFLEEIVVGGEDPTLSHASSAVAAEQAGPEVGAAMSRSTGEDALKRLFGEENARLRSAALRDLGIVTTAITQAMGDINPRYRTILALDLAGHDLREIAEIMGDHYETAKVVLMRARKAFREALDKRLAAAGVTTEPSRADSSSGPVPDAARKEV